jgi:cytoskeletal protein RodZ
VAPEKPAPTPQRPVEKAWFVPEGARWTGEMLRRARESRGMTVAQLAERTKITRHHIENVEADRFRQLPAPVYLRGIVMSISRELRLDGQKVARSYLEHMAASAGESS